MDVRDEGRGGVGKLADLAWIHVGLAHLEVSLTQLPELVEAHAENRAKSAQHQAVAQPAAYLPDLLAAQQQERSFDSYAWLGDFLNYHGLALFLLFLGWVVHLAPGCHIAKGIAYHSCVSQGNFLSKMLSSVVGKRGQLVALIGSIREQPAFALSEHIQIVALQFGSIRVGKSHFVEEHDLLSTLSDSVHIPDIDLIL